MSRMRHVAGFEARLAENGTDAGGPQQSLFPKPSKEAIGAPLGAGRANQPWRVAHVQLDTNAVTLKGMAAPTASGGTELRPAG